MLEIVRRLLPPAFAVALAATAFLNIAVARAADPEIAAPPFRIALVSDTHTTRGTAEDQALYKGRFDRVIADVNAARVDLVLIAGDLTQSGKPEECEDFRAQAKGFTAPVRYVYGNHDVGDKHVPGKPGGTTAERTRRIEETLGPSFFVDAYGGGRVRVIGVNSLLIGSGLPRESDQWAFLEKQMADNSGKRAITLLLSHFPPYLKAADEPGGGYWNIEPEPRKRLLDLLIKGNVRAVLSGHLHRPLQNEYEGIRLITTHPVSFGLPRASQPQGWTLVTVTSDGAIQTEARNLLEPR